MAWMAFFDLFCCSKRDDEAPQWDSTEILSDGGDKNVFLGTLAGKKVAICVPKTEISRARFLDEVKYLEKVGRHPHIVQMLHYSTSQRGSYLACEAVEPIGFDLDRLVRQYTFAGMSVPAGLARRMLAQLCSGIDHMHSRGILHRDLKTENVLCTGSYEAKVIDMGLACHIGHTESRWIFSRATYFAPEVCVATRQGTEIDAWGLGVILHQTYQHHWDILDASSTRKAPSFRARRPSTAEPMESSLREAMMGLLQLNSSKRWTTRDVQNAVPPDDVYTKLCSTGGGDWQPPAVSRLESRALLRKYKGSGSPLTAYAAVVDHRNQHLVGKSVGELKLRSKFGAIVLMIDVPGSATSQRSLQANPNQGTLIPQSAWLYIGVQSAEDEVSGLAQALFPDSQEDRRLSTASAVSSSGRSCNAKSGLIAFNLEFDSFTFPEHVEKASVIGREAAEGKSALNLRGNFGLNLAGIVRPGCQPEWFPGPEAEVAAGDMGLVVRCPCRDGTTEPTVTDDQLRGLMDKKFYDGTVSVGSMKAFKDMKLALGA